MKNAINQQIGVIGAGRVGLVLAACFAKLGHKVNVFEKNVKKRLILQSGKAPFFEAGLQDLLKTDLVFQNLTFLENFRELSGCNVIFSCVGTPSSANGAADLSQFQEVVSLFKNAFFSKKTYFVNKSTVPLGTMSKFAEILKKQKNVIVVNSPEFLREGSAIHDFMNPDRIVLGVQNNHENSFLLKFHEMLAPKNKVLFTDFVTSELIKYASNAMLAARLTAINQVSRFAHHFKADMQFIEKAVGLDHRIGPEYLRSGAGYFGSCLSKDISELVTLGIKKNINSSFFAEVEVFNEDHKKWYFEKVLKVLPKGGVLGILGAGFKAGTDNSTNALSTFMLLQSKKQGIKFLTFDTKTNILDFCEKSDVICATNDDALKEVLLLGDNFKKPLFNSRGPINVAENH